MAGVQYFQIYGQDPGPLPSSEPLYKKLEILKFEDIFNLNVANFVYSTLDFESPSIFHDWFLFQHEVHQHSTRMSTGVLQAQHFDVGVVEQTLKLHKQRFNNNYGKKTIKVLGPNIWNSIPDHILKTSSFNCFKTTLKKHFIGQYGTDDTNTVSIVASTSNRRNNTNRHASELTDERRNARRFQSRWNDGPNNLI